MNSSFFEIGGELIELEAEYIHGRKSNPKRRTQHSKTSGRRMVKAVDSMAKTAKEDDTWGPAQIIGYGIGLGAGVIYSTVTFPVVMADSPMIGPADLLWFASSIKFMSKSTAIGKKIGSEVDQSMGWN